jgi:hypothetical protein
VESSRPVGCMCNLLIKKKKGTGRKLLANKDMNNLLIFLIEQKKKREKEKPTKYYLT